MTATLPPPRPTGVTILALLAMIAGVLAALGAILLFAGAAILGVTANGDAARAGGAFGFAAGIVLLVYAAFDFAVAVGLLRRRRWAWYAAVVLAALGSLSGLSTLVTGGFLMGLATLAVALIAGWYLLSPPVQTWFGVSYNTPWQYRPGRPA